MDETRSSVFKRLGKKLLLLPPLLIGVGVLAFIVSSKKAPEQETPREQVRHVRVIETVENSLVPRVVGFGIVKPEKIWTAAAEVSGTIIYVHPDFKKGAILKAGTEIVRISPVDYDLAITRAEANINAIEARLDELKVSEQNTRQSLGIEQRALTLKETELERKQALLKRSAVSRSSVDQELRDTLNQRQRVQDIQNTLRLIPSQRRLQIEQKAVDLANLEAARLNRQRTSIKLPFDARIAEQNVEETQYAQTGQVLGVADSMGTAEVDAQIPLSRFRQMMEAISGQTEPLSLSDFDGLTEQFGLSAVVRLRMEDQNIEWKGRISRMSDTIDPQTRTLGVIASVENSYLNAIPGRKPPLIKGMFVEVEVQGRVLENRILIPRPALHNGKVYVAGDDMRLQIRDVEPGMVQGNVVVIRSGLKPGEKIVVSDLSPAISGMLLDLTNDEGLTTRMTRDATSGGSLK